MEKFANLGALKKEEGQMFELTEEIRNEARALIEKNRDRQLGVCDCGVLKAPMNYFHVIVVADDGELTEVRKSFSKIQLIEDTQGDFYLGVRMEQE